VRDADRIAVLDHGRMLQTGTHAELLQSSPLYQRMLTAYGGVQ
jgi:ABC-type multidrug transport system fused ATPase/permease subunit